jgi:hypothetical protein
VIDCIKPREILHCHTQSQRQRYALLRDNSSDFLWPPQAVGVNPRSYPTDIYAGRVLAQAIVRKLKENPDFQKDFAGAKAEIAAAQVRTTPAEDFTCPSGLIWFPPSAQKATANQTGG